MAKIGFIGTGCMGSAVAHAVSHAVGDCELLFSNRTEKKAETLACELRGAVSDNCSIARDCDVIFLGVKPQGLGSLLREISPIMLAREEKPTVISMAAGVKIPTIEALTLGEIEVIRMMPNTPLLVGCGLVLYCGSRKNSHRLRQFGNWMSEAGEAELVEESMMDAASAISGCGPAFCAMFLEAMADGGVYCGLPREKALRYAAQTLIGTGELLLQLEKPPSVLKDEVCSPAGSTICGVAALERNGFRHSVISAVQSAYEKTQDLGQK